MKFSNLETQNKILILSFVIFLGLYLLLSYDKKTVKTSKEVTDKIETADTYIPAGHVLLPIEIENVDSVSAIIGAFALVDLYTRPPQSAEPQMLLVAQKIKLIRAPLNPNQYAVLVTEAQSTELLKLNPRFWVTIHNQKNVTKPISTFKNSVKIAEVSNLSELTEQKKIKKTENLKKKHAEANTDIVIEYYKSKKVGYL